jgi:hypothetical protein
VCEGSTVALQIEVDRCYERVQHFPPFVRIFGEAGKLKATDGLCCLQLAAQIHILGPQPLNLIGGRKNLLMQAMEGRLVRRSIVAPDATRFRRFRVRHAIYQGFMEDEAQI